MLMLSICSDCRMFAVYHGHEDLTDSRLYKTVRRCLSVSRAMVIAVVFSSLAFWPQHLRYCALRAVKFLHRLVVLSRIQASISPFLIQI